MSRSSTQEKRPPARTDYELLPFRFMRMSSNRVLLVNEVGEHLFVDNAILHDLVTHQLRTDESHYSDLEGKHFLRNPGSMLPVELLATKYRTKKSFLSGFTRLHMFVVTLRCDHSCLYCQVSRVSPNMHRYDMSIATADRALDLLLHSNAEDIKIEFQGGEPLLNFDVIRHIVGRVASGTTMKRIEYVIATNLSNLTDEMLDFMKHHRITVSTSLDGPANVHDTNRPRPGGNSHELTLNGIDRVRHALGDEGISALMTTTRLSLSHPKEIVDEYLGLGFKSIFLRPTSPFGFAVRTRRAIGYDIKEFLRFYKEALDYILELNMRGVYIEETYAQIILTKILTPYATGFVDLQSPSGAGIGAVAYNYDGDVYASDESRMLAEMGDKMFRLGNVHQHSYDAIFGGETIRALAFASCNESLPGCYECAFQAYCGGDGVRNYVTQGDIIGHRPTSDFCQKNMGIIRHLFNLIDQDGDKLMPIFLSWLVGGAPQATTGIAA